MRVTSSSQGGGGGGVVGGVYPSPMSMKYVQAKDYANFAGGEETEGVLIPANYIDSGLQTAVDDAYSQVSDFFAQSIGPIDDGEIIRVKAPTFAKYLNGNLMTLSPMSSLNTDLDGYIPINGGSQEIGRFFNVDTNKIGVLWLVKDGNNRRFYFKIADRSSGKNVWTAAQLVTGINSGGAGITSFGVQQLDTNKIAIVYSDEDNSDRISAVAFSVDANGLLDTVGSVFQIATDANQSVICLEYVAQDKMMICWGNCNGAIISASGLTLSKGSTVALEGTAANTSRPTFRYLSDNKLIMAVPNAHVSDGKIYFRVVSISGTTITLETEANVTTSVAAPVTGLGFFVRSASVAHLWIVVSSNYRVYDVSISGTTATPGGSVISGLDSGDRFIGNVSEGKLYRIDTNANTIYRYDASASPVVEAQFTFQNDISWPALPTNGIDHNHRIKDFRNGFAIYSGDFNANNLDLCYGRMISSGIDVDVTINNTQCYTNTGSDSFGLVAFLDNISLDDSDVIEIELTNQSGGFRGFEINNLLVTVN